MFPQGHVGLTHFAIRFNDRQIYPNLVGNFMSGSGVVLPFEPNEDLLEAPHKITLVGFNEDDTFDHTIYVWFEIQEKLKGFNLMKFLK